MSERRGIFELSSLQLTVIQVMRRVCHWQHRSPQRFIPRLHLLMVVPKLRNLTGLKAATSLLLPGATRFNLETESEGARTYLDQRAAELNRQGVLADYETSRGDPARAITASARRLSADLVVMGTHGRAGADAFWAGSVAARVVAHIQAPLMLVPLGKNDEQRTL